MAISSYDKYIIDDMTSMIKILLLPILFLVAESSLASNIIRTAVPVQKAVNTGEWLVADPSFTEWTVDSTSSCTAWAPLPENVSEGYAFDQNQTCYTEESRLQQPREVNSLSGAYRSAGTAIEETRSSQKTFSQASVGTGIFDSEYFVAGWGSCPYGQYGYTTNGTCSNNVFYEGSMPSSQITYFTYGYNSTVLLGTSPQMALEDLLYLKVEMINASGAIFYTKEYTSGFRHMAGYIGPMHSQIDLDNAKLASRFKVSFNKKR